MFSAKKLSAGRRISIALISSNAAAAEKLGAELAAQGELDFNVMTAAEALALQSASDLDVFVYDLNVQDRSALQDFRQFMIDRPSSVPVIVMSAGINDDLVRWFLRLQVADWLSLPVTAGELLTSCARVTANQKRTSSTTRCLTFMSASGGAGSTTLAVAAGIEMLRLSKGRQNVGLVDLDTFAGMSALYLDLDAGWRFEDLEENPRRLDLQMYELMAGVHKSGLSVLAAQNPLFASHANDVEIVTTALEIGSQRFQTLIIDLPHPTATCAEAVIGGSDEVFVVCECSIPSLRQARRVCDDIVQHFSGSVRPKVIVNKFQRKLFGSGVTGHEAKKLLESYLACFIPNCESLVREAIDRGVALTEVKKNNPISTELSKLLAASADDTKATRKGKK